MLWVAGEIFGSFCTRPHKSSCLQRVVLGTQQAQAHAASVRASRRRPKAVWVRVEAVAANTRAAYSELKTVHKMLVILPAFLLFGPKPRDRVTPQNRGQLQYALSAPVGPWTQSSPPSSTLFFPLIPHLRQHSLARFPTLWSVLQWSHRLFQAPKRSHSKKGLCLNAAAVLLERYRKKWTSVGISGLGSPQTRT